MVTDLEKIREVLIGKTIQFSDQTLYRVCGVVELEDNFYYDGYTVTTKSESGRKCTFNFREVEIVKLCGIDAATTNKDGKEKQCRLGN